MKVVVETDQRRCAVEPAPEAERVLRSQARRFASLEADLARALAEVENKRSYLLHGARSVQEWAEKQGYGPRQVRQLLDLGRALIASPRLEAKVRAGKVTAESAAQVGRVLADEAVQAEEAEWLRRAESMPPRQLKDAAVAAIEEAHQAESTIPLQLRVTRSARRGFQRARQLLSRGQRKLVTEGETFGVLVDDFLERQDPQRRPLPQRRAASARKGRSRRIPARVVAELERRSGGRCEICRGRRAVEKMHLQVPHARGGTREVDNLADACHQCHLLADAGYYRFARFNGAGQPEWTAHPERISTVRERAPPFAWN
ncbi:MAG: HNH endonuclease [Planctomycetota bacterium]